MSNGLLANTLCHTIFDAKGVVSDKVLIGWITWKVLNLYKEHNYCKVYRNLSTLCKWLMVLDWLRIFVTKVVLFSPQIIQTIDLLGRYKVFASNTYN